MLWMAHLLTGLVFAQVGPGDASDGPFEFGDRPSVPSTTLAGESGPGSMWVNPANIGFDKDPHHGLFLQTSPDNGLGSLGAVIGVGGTSFGLNSYTNPVGNRDWTLDYSASATTPGQLSMGFTSRLHLVQDLPNFATYDVGVAWRPTLGSDWVALHRTFGARTHKA